MHCARATSLSIASKFADYYSPDPEYIGRTMIEVTVVFLWKSKESSNRFAVKNKRNKKIADALRGSGLPRRDEAKGGRKEGRKEGLKRKGKEVWPRLVGNFSKNQCAVWPEWTLPSSPLGPERPFLSLKLAPFAFNYTKERSTERISHATAQDPPVMVLVFKTGRTFLREAIFVWGTRRNSIDPRGDARTKLDGWIVPRFRGPTRVVFGAFLEIECRGRNILLSIHARAPREERVRRGFPFG